MCCSFIVIQGAHVEISMDASNFTPLSYRTLLPEFHPWCYRQSMNMLHCARLCVQHAGAHIQTFCNKVYCKHLTLNKVLF
jgi:hypothetical protein